MKRQFGIEIGVIRLPNCAEVEIVIEILHCWHSCERQRYRIGVAGLFQLSGRFKNQYLHTRPKSLLTMLSRVSCLLPQ